MAGGGGDVECGGAGPGPAGGPRRDRHHSARRLSDGRLLLRAPQHRRARSAEGQGDRVSAGDDPGGDGGVRPAGHAAVDVERGPGAGGPAHRHSGREHRDHRDPHPHRAALRRRAGAPLQRAGRIEVRDRPARGGEISRDAAGPAGRGHRGGECPGFAGGAGAARGRGRPGLVQPPLSSEGRHRPLQPGCAESRDRAGRRSDRSGAPVPAVHQGQETGGLVDGVRAARRHRWRDGVLRGLSGSAGRRADPRVRRRFHLGLRPGHLRRHQSHRRHRAAALQRPADRPAARPSRSCPLPRGCR